MTNYFHIAIVYVIAYLLGSVPTSVWIGRLFFKKDPRNYGSGNAGATNTLRVFGYKTAIPVLLIDIAKGVAAVLLFYRFTDAMSDIPYYQYLVIGSGLLAVVGHIYSVFLKFDGGKGVATFAGVALALSPVTLLICLLIFITIISISRYVSLSSIGTAISYPIICLFTEVDNQALFFFSILTAVVIVITHRQNIKRLLQKKESKISFRKKPLSTS